MYDHLNAYLRKQPKYLIHITTNDASIKDKTSDIIFKQILQLKRYMENKVHGIEVTISCPIICFDNGLANLKIIHLRNKLKTENMSIIDNENIWYECLGQKGLHMTSRYGKVSYEFYNIHKASLALDLSNILYITSVTPIVIKTFHVIYSKI